jgi:hypothetical protein
MRNRNLLLGLLVAGQGACMRSVRVRERPAEYLLAHNPGRAWITPVNGEPFEMIAPRVILNGVYGWSKGIRVSIPADQVAELTARQLSMVRTSLLAGFGLAVGAAIVVARKHSETGCAPEEVEPEDAVCIN